ncbi:hypothetical protein H0E87_020703 [Populus deltoides]|uniref:CS domain-containing protein n=1 Tax=Populus deltoides TaxID=3696 RepID=A0A8T2XPH2_POPDE|nr:hypothetical protein H0E87_020703 [Populus deltoides]
MAEDLALDLQELRQLGSIAKRPRVVSLISSEISHLEKLSKEHVSDPHATSTPIQTPILSGVKLPSSLAINYVTLGSFSWDQDNDKVKIYVSLEGVGREKIESEFQAMSFDVKFHDVQGKNYRCAIPKLNKEIVPEKCLVVVKPKRVIITLFKASKGNWLDIHFKDDKVMTFV